MKKITRLIQGNEAIAEGALYAGCKFFGGYPITPSSEIGEILATRLPQIGGKFIQMEDEIAAMAACIGASIAGVKALTATSGPGFSLKQENLGYASMTEVPCVIVNVMRGGPSTGAPTMPSQGDVMQARWGTHGDHSVIAIYPESIKESFHETIRAFNLSEKYRVPVILLSDEIVGHMREKFTFPEPGEVEIIERTKPTVRPKDYLPYDTKFGLVPPMANFGDGYRFHITGLNHDHTGFPTNDPKKIKEEQVRLIDKIRDGFSDILKYEEYKLEDADTLIIAYGPIARSAKVAVNVLRRKGYKIGLFRPITLWPAPVEKLIEINKKIKKTFVAELNLGQYVYEIERFIPRASITRILRADCEPISPSDFISQVESEIG